MCPPLYACNWISHRIKSRLSWCILNHPIYFQTLFMHHAPLRRNARTPRFSLFLREWAFGLQLRARCSLQSAVLVFDPAVALNGDRRETSVILTSGPCGAHLESRLQCAQTTCGHCRRTSNSCSSSGTQNTWKHVWHNWERGLRGVLIFWTSTQQHGVTCASHLGWRRGTSEIHLERVFTPQAVWMGSHCGLHYCILRFTHWELAWWVVPLNTFISLSLHSS